MFFSKFSSLYELFVASNLASVVSDTFNSAIESKVLTNYDSTIKWNTNIKSKVNVAKETIESVLKNPQKNIINQKELKGLTDNFRLLNDRFDIINKEVEETKSTESFKFIPVLSSFCALYSMSILIISGFWDDEHHSYEYWNAIGLINFLSVFFISYSASKKENSISFPRVVIIFIAIILIGILSYLLVPLSWFIVPCKENLLTYIIITTSLIIPIFHYLLFVLFGSINSYIKIKSLKKNLKDYEMDFNSFQEQLGKITSVVQNLDIINPRIVAAAVNKSKLTNVSVPKSEISKKAGQNRQRKR